jgi:hypothetical protein
MEYCTAAVDDLVFTRVRRETGGKERVQVPYDEGRANHIGPESCVSDREVWGEALTGEVLGQVLSHVTKPVRDADAFCVAEGNMVGCVSHEWLIRFIEHRVGDRRVVRLIRKWLKAGVAEDGQVMLGAVGTPQGAVITP